ncbi:hypothetical protein POHY109586_16135 [Polaromonas hydrogenivorans]
MNQYFVCVGNFLCYAVYSFHLLKRWQGFTLFALEVTLSRCGSICEPEKLPAVELKRLVLKATEQRSIMFGTKAVEDRNVSQALALYLNRGRIR